MNKNRIRNIVFSSLFVCLYFIGTVIRIPFPVVPIVLTNFFLLIAGFILGPLWGGISVLLYIALGAFGVPVFSAGGGIAALTGPTGGYIAGYLLCAVLAGIFRNIGKGNLWSVVAGGVISFASIYLTGLTWLRYKLEITWMESISIGLIPYLIGDVIKLATAVIILHSIFKYNRGLLLNMHTDETSTL